VPPSPSTNSFTNNNVEVVAASGPPDKACFSPADARPAPVDRGEDDWTYFRARPALTRRLRFPLVDELPLDMTDLGVALVSVRMDRDEFGQPGKRGQFSIAWEVCVTAYPAASRTAHAEAEGREGGADVARNYHRHHH
jgi:hypothetical protein